MNIVLSPVGWVRSDEKGPREDFWGAVVSEIVLDDQRFTEDAFAGLGEFSHVEVCITSREWRRAPSLQGAGTRAEIRPGQRWACSRRE
jgi:tRNA (Thr-GGU) A37 N-methylase